MKILFINSLDKRYGSSYRARNMVFALRSAGHSVSYCESNSDLSGPGDISVEQKDNIWGYLKASLKRAHLAVSGSHDIVYIQKFTPLTAFAIIAAKLSARKLFVDWDDLDSEFQNTFLRKMMTVLCEKALPGLCDAVSTHSRFLKELCEKKLCQKAFFVPQVCDTLLFDPSAVRIDRLQDRNVKDAVVVGFAGTLTEGGARDLDILIGGAALAAKKGRKVFFLVAGGGPIEQKVDSMLKSSGVSGYRITGIVSQRDMPSLIAGFDLALIYMRDNTGNRMRVSLKLLEYLAMNVPVAGKVVGESREVFKGLYDEASDEESISEAILRFKTTEKRPTRENITGQYDMPAMIKSLREIINGEPS